MKEVIYQPLPQLYARCKTLAGLFDMKESFVKRLFSKMRENPAYRDYFITRPKYVAVRIDKFEQFLKEGRIS